MAVAAAIVAGVGLALDVTSRFISADKEKTQAEENIGELDETSADIERTRGERVSDIRDQGDRVLDRQASTFGAAGIVLEGSALATMQETRDILATNIRRVNTAAATAEDDVEFAREQNRDVIESGFFDALFGSVGDAVSFGGDLANIFGDDEGRGRRTQDTAVEALETPGPTTGGGGSGTLELLF